MAVPSRYGIAHEVHDHGIVGRVRDTAAGRSHNARSLSKAEKLLGVMDTSGVNAQIKDPYVSDGRNKLRKKTSDISFTFSDLKGVLSGASRWNKSGHSSPRTPGFGLTDSESITSISSPTFDPAASTSTLPSTYDSPTTPYPAIRQMSNASSKDSGQRHVDIFKASGHKRPQEPELSQILEAGANSIADDQTKRYDLPPLDLPPLSPRSATSKSQPLSPVNRMRSSASNGTMASESTARGKRLARKAAMPHGRDIAIDQFKAQNDDRLAALPEVRPHKKLGRQVQDWLDRAELDRSPSLAGRPLPRSSAASSERPFSPQSSTTSIKTLTSQLDGQSATAGRHGEPPLPDDDKIYVTTSSPTSSKSSRIHQTDLRIESVLSLSSSEDESDGEAQAQRRRKRESRVMGNPETGDLLASPKRKPQHYQHSYGQIPETSGQSPTNSRPPANRLRYPKRSLAEISAASAKSSRQPFSALNWQLNDETELGAICMAAVEEAFSPQPTDADQRQAKPSNLRISTDTVIPPKRRDEHFRTLLETPKHSETTGSQVISPISPPLEMDKDEATKEPRLADTSDTSTMVSGLDISSFPAPPRARSGSAVPTIQIESDEGSREVTPRPSRAVFPDMSTVLLTPSTGSRANSIGSNSPTHSSNSSLNELPLMPQELYGSHVAVVQDKSMLTRKPTISNVPIYVTGLESCGSDDDMGGEMDGATFVFSNMF